MNDCKRYVPVLRFKPAELNALADLFKCGVDLSRLTPLLELVPQLLTKDKLLIKPMSHILDDIAHKILEHWGTEQPFFLDLGHLPSDLLAEGGKHPFVAFNSCAQIRDLYFIPVIALSGTSTPAYQSAVGHLIRSNGHGACLRLLPKDLQSPTLFNDIDRLLQYLSVGPNDVDLIIDQQYIAQLNFSYFSLHEISNLVPFLQSWRTFTIISGSFPVNLSQFMKHTKPILPRMEWRLWLNQIKSELQSLRMPDYGDYTIRHPIFTHEEEEEVYTPSANIRYTSKNSWIVMRGESLKSGQKFKQYPALAQLLCDEEDFCGPNYSFGDKYIHDMSLVMDNPDQGGPTGNATTWLQAGINHHIVFVLRQLSSQPLI